MLIPCSRGVTRAGQGAEPAQNFRQPCQAGRVMEDYKALVDPPVFTLLCGHSTLILNLTILIKIRDPESRWNLKLHMGFSDSSENITDI